MAATTQTTQEVWFRNPSHYIKELIECGVSNITFDLGTLRGNARDPFKFLQLHYPSHLPWRLLVMDDRHKAATEFNSEAGNSPTAKHPMWTQDEPIARLEKLLSNEERVIVLWKRFNSDGKGHLSENEKLYLHELSEIQLANPNCILHLKGMTSISNTCAYHFRAFDIECRTSAAHGHAMLPHGGTAYHRGTMLAARRWLRLIGHTPEDFDVPRERCMINIRSALWAARYYKQNVSPITQRRQINNYDTSEFQVLEKKKPSVSVYRDKERLEEESYKGNFYLCNACALQLKCDFFRQGSVCAVPGSEPTELANFFGSRDPEVIKVGLSNLLMFESNRVMDAAEKESASGEIDPGLTAMVHGLFDRGLKMVKLQDPSTRGPLVNINMGVPSPGLPSGQDMAKNIVAGIIAELEGRGVPRSSITKEMMQGILSHDDKQKAIEGAVIASRTELL